MPTWDNDNKEGQASKKGRKREEIQAPKIGRNDYFDGTYCTKSVFITLG